MPPPNKGTKGLVYFAHAEDVEAIKIGFTTDLRQRLRLISLERGCDIRLEAAKAGTLSTERELHVRFAHLWLSGEWFLADSSLVNFARSLPSEVQTYVHECSIKDEDPSPVSVLYAWQSRRGLRRWQAAVHHGEE